MVVMGVDACATGWVGVVLAEHPTEVVWTPAIAELAAAVASADVIAVDIPIGLPDADVRACDVEARRLVGARRSSVFATPVRAALEAPTYPEANEACRRVTGSGLSRQAYGLARKILEVEAWLRNATVPVFEVHPEVSFARIAGHPMSSPKKRWAGVYERRLALEREGIGLDGDLGDAGRQADVDDVLDAAAAAWSARRIGAGEAISLPANPPLDARGRPVAIWA
jgi:predicted RNase H-like nuclease